MHFPTRLAIFSAVALIGGFGSYAAGLSGVDPAVAITQARCSSGAFIAHAQPPKTLQADAHPGSQGATTAEPDAATAITKPVAATGANLIANPGVEALTGDQPTGWFNTKNGNNDAAFTQVAGHNSGRALRVDITKYGDGSADWYAPDSTVTPGGYYVYSDYYRSNVSTHPVLMLKDDQGKQQYIALPSANPSMSWSQYSARFFVPSNVKDIQVAHALDRLGSLETDDISLTQATPAAFNDPLVSITFDDGWQSIHDQALPIMKRYQVVSTQYLVTGFLGTKGYDKPGQVYDFVSAGHEIASHTVDHRDLTNLSDKDLKTELTNSAKGLSSCYGSVTDFASPYGTYNVRTTTQEKATYKTARSTDEGFNSADQFNPYELKVETVSAATTPEQIQAWLDTAKTDHLWLILVYHQIDTTSHGAYSRTPDQFESDIQKIVTSGIPVKTIRDAYAEVQPQLKH